MAKNYKKIYLRLKKDIEKQIDLYQTYRKPMDRSNFIDELELAESIHILGHLLLTMEEFEGKCNHGICFNSKEFEQWKKKVVIK